MNISRILTALKNGTKNIIFKEMLVVLLAYQNRAHDPLSFLMSKKTTITFGPGLPGLKEAQRGKRGLSSGETPNLTRHTLANAR
jgi:hypothetical protein